MSKNNKMTSDASLLQEIYEGEEEDNIVYSIREELMERVMTECNRSYIRKQTVKFIVQCAYDAMVKFLSINFYYHCEPPDTRATIWMPDDPVEPSPKDTWAHSAVPIRSRDFKDDLTHEEVINTTINNKSTSTEYFGSCNCSHLCDCILSQAGIYKSLTLSYAKPCPSKVKFSPKSSRLKIEEKFEFKDDRASKTMLESSPSSEMSFTHRSTTDTSRSQSENVSPALVITREEIKKKKEKLPAKETKLEVPPAVERGSHASTVKLLPIRVNTKFTSKPENTKKKKKK